MIDQKKEEKKHPDIGKKEDKGEKEKKTEIDHGKMAEKYLDSWKRCQADFENFKKDQAKYQEEFRKYAKMDVIEQILPVVDNFEASLAHVPEAEKDNKWVEGLVYIKKQLEDVLRNNSVEEIEAKTGDKFNPEIHEAVAGKGEKVKKVLQKGYRMNGRIVRAARVEVG
jgi:molecular chaperone GrpE